MWPIFQKNNSIRKKLVSTYILAMGTALIITFTIFAVIAENDIEKRLYKSDLQSTQVFSKYLNIKIDEIKKVSLELALNVSLQNALSDNENVANKNKISNIINNVVINNSDIDAIYLVDNSGSLYIADNEPYYTVDPEYIKEKDPKEEILAQKGGVFTYIERKGFIDTAKDTIALGRSIISQDDLSNLGYFIIYIKKSVLDTMYREFTDYRNVDYIFTDSLNNNLYFSSNLSEGDKIVKDNYNEDGYSKVEINNKKKKAIITDINILNREIIAIPNTSGSNEYIVILIILLILLNVIFLILYSIFISKSVLKPLDSIANATKQIESIDDLNTKFTVEESYLELDFIINALNEMMRRVKELLHEVQNKQKLQNKLELDKLNNQVKPHFLYNTLNVVSSLIYIDRNDEANELIQSLSRYYRESLNSGNEIVVLGEEISILYDYVNILKLKDSTVFNINYKIDNSLINYKVPKLIMQPLVENCVKYGVKDKDRPLNITVTISKSHNGEGFIINVADDGIGIDEERLKAIYNREKLKGTSGFGLKSILERISLYYEVNDPFELVEISSNLGSGTNIKIVLPRSLE